MKRLVSSITLVALLYPQICFADPPVSAALTPIPAGDDRIVAVREGEKVQFTGQLFDQSTSIRWANYLQQCQLRLRLDPLYQYKLDQVEIQGLQDTVKLERKKYDEVTSDLNTKLATAQEEAANPPFYRTFWFGAAVGVTASLLLVVGAAALVGSAK